MKYAMLSGALALGFVLSGCNSLSSNIQNDAAAINNITAALNTPAAQQAIASLQRGWTGIVCGVNAASALTAAVSADMKATATVNGARIAQMTSATLCAAAGGVVASSAQ